MNYITLGQHLEAARKAAGKTQLEASEVLDIARTSYLNIEAGRRRLKVGELKRLADWLGMPVEDLTRGAEDEMDVMTSGAFPGIDFEPHRRYAFLTEQELELVKAFRAHRWLEAVTLIMDEKRECAE